MKFLYLLRDPLSNLIHWIGQTSQVGRRKARSVSRASLYNTGKRAWLRRLAKKNLHPKMEVLAVLTDGDAKATEERLILKLRSKGVPLFNLYPKRRMRVPPSQESTTLIGSEPVAPERFDPGDPVGYLDPIADGRTKFTRSRLAILSDGTTLPVLLLLSFRKYGKAPQEWEPSGLFPFWLDGDYKNETLENIELAVRPPKQYRRRELGPQRRKELKDVTQKS